MIQTLRKQVDGITYFWYLYRDGRTIQIYQGVTEQWKLDQDFSDEKEEQYTTRRQAKRRMEELVAEKKAEGYRQDDIYGMQPGREEREKFRRWTSRLAYLLVALGLFQFVTPFSVLPIVVFGTGISLMLLAFLSKDHLPIWLRTICFIGYFFMHVIHQQESYISYLFPILSIGMGTLLWFHLRKTRQKEKMEQ
ncbi:hypothetical protein [uncultured Exiguobacterium sp.]|uniref:hypothetical protein n=1 Tax=uncultured Exiguobacterium sp. TaxID=202669 RepID=UPI0025CDC4FE|nr:hypothetical protein [uncultured Exiguobacterium sp.]